VSSERELLQSFAASVDLDRVRIYSSHTRFGRLVGILSRGSAVALGYRIVVPGRLRLPVLAHELTHVSQFERWGALRYFVNGIWHQFILRGLLRRDVYRWELEPGKPFERYGMEQQGQIVQDCYDHASGQRTAARLISPFAPR
jgi:hypothetical protein